MKASAELPEDFKEPTIDDDILKHCPLFGKKEQKKKKLIGNVKQEAEPTFLLQSYHFEQF